MSDLMLYGVLRMPYDMAMSSELSRRQFYDRVQEAADRLQRAEAASPAAAVPDAQAEQCKLRLCCRNDQHAPGCTTYDPSRYPETRAWAAVPEGALPPLPEPKVFVKRSEWHDALTKRQSFNGWRVNYGDCDMHLYTVEQVRDAQRGAVEADREQQGEPVDCAGEFWRERVAENAADVAAEHVDMSKMYDEFRRLKSILKTPGYCDGTKYTERQAFYMAIATKAAAPADAPTDELASLAQRMAAWLNGLSRAELPFDSWKATCAKFWGEWRAISERAAPVPDTGIPKYKDITDHNGKIVGVQLVNWDERPRYDRAPVSTTPTSGDVEKPACRMQGGICACRAGGSYGGCAIERGASKIEWERDRDGNVRVKAFISGDDIARLHDDPVARVLMRKPEQTASDVCLLMESVFHRAAPAHPGEQKEGKDHG